MKIVLDTNVLVSGLINGYGPPGKIIDLIRTGLILPVVDDQILDEYDAVLRRPRLQQWISPDDVEPIMEFLRKEGVYRVANRFYPGLPDPDDAMFAELASTENVPLITGNTRHFPPDLCPTVQVYSPQEFLELYANPGKEY